MIHRPPVTRGLSMYAAAELHAREYGHARGPPGIVVASVAQL
jgi:hypothetical protein